MAFPWWFLGILTFYMEAQMRLLLLTILISLNGCGDFDNPFDGDDKVEIETEKGDKKRGHRAYTSELQEILCSENVDRQPPET